MQPNFLFSSKDNLTLQINNLGINNWNELTKYIQNLPYGRNSNRHDLSLVLREKQGTCSSKHAFLKEIAAENKLENIKLYIGIYKMNSRKNTIYKTYKSTQTSNYSERGNRTHS